MPNKDEPNWGPLVGIGLQVLVGVVLGLVVGQWLDRKFGWAPWGMIVGVFLGLAAGMYSMIREGIRANRDPPDWKRPRNGNGPKDGQ